MPNPSLTAPSELTVREGDTVRIQLQGNDLDGDPDLYLPGLEEHVFYRNDGGTQFADVTDSVFAGLSDAFPPVFAAAAADFDQDGSDDLYLGRWFLQEVLLLLGCVREAHLGHLEIEELDGWLGRATQRATVGSLFTVYAGSSAEVDRSMFLD